MYYSDFHPNNNCFNGDLGVVECEARRAQVRGCLRAVCGLAERHVAQRRGQRPPLVLAPEEGRVGVLDTRQRREVGRPRAAAVGALDQQPCRQPHLPLRPPLPEVGQALRRRCGVLVLVLPRSCPVLAAAGAEGTLQGNLDSNNTTNNNHTNNML